MSRTLAARLVCALCLIVPGVGLAGARVQLERGQPVALPQSKVKSLVAEFVDPESTGLGAAVATVLGGELLDAVSDVPGAGVLVATDREHMGLVAQLGKDYHRAAVEIAREQQAMLAVWGVVEGAGSKLLLESYVSQVPNSALGTIGLQLAMESEPIPGFKADISSRSFHFAPRMVPRSWLFRRRLVLLHGLRQVRERPAAGSRLVATLQSGARMTSDTLVGAWWRVRFDGGVGWIEDDPNIVRIPPREVETDGAEVTTHATPGGAKRATLTLRGRYRLLDVVYTANGKWLRIEPVGKVIGALPAWVRGRQSLRARYTLPCVHFMAGVYRYRVGRHQDAVSDFEASVRQSPGEDNVTLSAMHQLLGLSRVESKPHNLGALPDFDRAVALTPFDARARSMRALAAISAHSEIRREVVLDLDDALQLDPGDRVARNIVFGMKDLLAMRDTGQDRFGSISWSVASHRADVARLFDQVAAVRDTTRWSEKTAKEE